MAIDNDILKNYVEKVFRLKGQRDVTTRDLKNVALDLGLTDKDLEEIEKTIEDHRTRGENYMTNQCWEDAIGEFQNALSLSPLNPDILIQLAEAHYSKGKSTHSRMEFKQAEDYSRKCIAYDPNNKQAFNLIRKIRQPGSDEKKKKGISGPVVLITILLIAGVAAGVFLLTMREGEAAVPEPREEETYLSTAGDSGESTIPITFLENRDTQDLSVIMRDSVLERFNDSFSYEMRADITVTNIRLVELELKVSLLDKRGEVLFAEFMRAQDDYQPHILPGDTLPANILFYEEETDPGVAAAEVSVSFLKKENYAVNKITYPQKELLWPVPKPAGVSLVVHERENSLSSGFNTSYHRLTFEVVNNGALSVRLLKLRVDWFDDEGKVFENNETYVSAVDDPSFLPGQQRLGFIIQDFQNLKPETDNYNVNVIEIR